MRGADDERCPDCRGDFYQSHQTGQKREPASCDSLWRCRTKDEANAISERSCPTADSPEWTSPIAEASEGRCCEPADNLSYAPPIDRGILPPDKCDDRLPSPSTNS